MSEPSSGVPSEIADAEVETPDAESEEPTEVTLDLDEDKLEAWDEIKSDYQVDPDADQADDATDADATDADATTTDADDGASPPG